MHPSIPFNPNAYHVNSAMNTVGFAFGAGSRPGPSASPGFARFGSPIAFGGPNWASGSGSQQNPQSTSTQQQTSFRSSSTTPARPRAKRRRSSTDSSSPPPPATDQSTPLPGSKKRRPSQLGDQEPGNSSSSSLFKSLPDINGSSSSELPHDHQNLQNDPKTNKKLRMERNGGRNDTSNVGKMGASDSPGTLDMNGQKQGADEAEQEQDIGILLASLPSSSLLPLIHSLLTKRPSLKPLLLSLIPTPELTDILEILRKHAKQVAQDVPFGRIEAGRESLVARRIGSSLTKFATNVDVFMGRYLSAEQVTIHPSLPPSLLLPLTHLILTAILPLLPPKLSVSTDPSLSLLQSILSRVVKAWNEWVKELGVFVNTQGGMFSEGVVRGWEAGLDEIVAVSQALVAKDRHSMSSDEESLGSTTSKQGDRRASDLSFSVTPATSTADRTPSKVNAHPSTTTLFSMKTTFGQGLYKVRDDWIDSAGWMVGRSRPVEGFEHLSRTHQHGLDVGGDFKMG